MLTGLGVLFMMEWQKETYIQRTKQAEQPLG